MQGSFFYATALPIAALFALGQKRILHLAGVIVWVIVAFTLVVPAQAAFLRDSTFSLPRCLGPAALVMS